MRRHSTCQFLFLIIVVISLSACASGAPSPEYYGAFIRDGGKLVELPVVQGGFNVNNPVNIPDFDNSPSAIVY